MINKALLIFIVFLSLGKPTYGSTPLQSESSYLLLSPTEKLSVEKIHLRSKEFISSKAPNHNFGFKEQNGWTKSDFIIDKPDDIIIHFYQFFVDYLQVYIYHEDTLLFTSSQTGMKVFQQNSKAPYYLRDGYAIPYTLSKKGNYTIYTHAISNYSPLRMFTQVWTESNFNTRPVPFSLKKEFWFFLFGIICFVALIALLFFFFTREIIFGLYFFFLLIHLINAWVARGFVGPILPYFKFYTYDVRGLFNAILVISVCLFFRELIPKKYSHPFFNKYFTIVPIYVALLLLLSLLLPKSRASYMIIGALFRPALFLSFYMPVILFIVSIVKGHKTSWFYLAGYSVLFITTLLVVLMNLKLIKFDYVTYYWEVGMLIELLTFGVAFAYRYHLKTKERQTLLETINTTRKEYLDKYYLSQEQEREKIAKEIHDGVIQRMVSLKMQFNQDEQIDNSLVSQLDNVTEELRDISHGLMPKSLLKLGLKNAIEDLLINSFDNSKINYSFNTHNFEHKRLSQSIKFNVYRITQELITNSIKHSQCTKIDLQLYVLQSTLHLVFEDNGIGLLNSLNKIEGFGIKSIRSRIESIDGTLILNEIPKGLSYHLKIPLQ